MTEYVGTKNDATDLATQGDLSAGGASATPSGVVSAFAGSSAPSGWLLCDGSTVSRTTYSDLFAAIGTTYGSGDGSTTFTLPSLKGRMPVGLDSAQTEFDALAETGGAKAVTLATTEIPSHSHTSGTLATDTEAAHSHTSGTLLTDTVGSHTHADGTLATDTASSHSHADGTLATDTTGSHTHTVGNESGQHSHNYDRSTISVSTGSNFVRTGGGNAVTAVSLTNTSTATSLATLKVTSDGSHSHDVTGSTGSAGSHSHDVTGSTGSAGSHSHAVNGSTDTAGSHSHSVNTGSTGSTGGGSGHNNLPPYVVMNYIIKT